MYSYINPQSHIKELGERIRLYRINMGITQQKLEEMSGVSQRSISRLEQGASLQMDSFIKILTALQLDGNLELLVPDQRKRPSYYLKEDCRPRQRATSNKDKKRSFVWGDEK